VQISDHRTKKRSAQKDTKITKIQSASIKAEAFYLGDAKLTSQSSTHRSPPRRLPTARAKLRQIGGRAAPHEKFVIEVILPRDRKTVKEVVGTRALQTHWVFGDGIARRLLLRVSLVKRISAAWRF